jgi:hypothetical protein
MYNNNRKIAMTYTNDCKLNAYNVEINLSLKSINVNPLMKQLNIFKENVKFTNWGELYAGCKRNWITSSDVLDFCEKKLIRNVYDEQYVELHLALDDSLFAFYEKLKEYIIKENAVPIIKNEDELTNYVFDYIPSIYFRIWELEFLLEIKNAPLSNTEKLDEIAFVFDAMNYPENWKVFLYYQHNQMDCVYRKESYIKIS